MDLSAEAERTALVANAVRTANENPNAERVRLPWRTGYYSATVVDLPVDKVMLNPRSHRIRAQLESSSKRELVEDDPFSEAAQDAIADLLRQAEEFVSLRANLADVGQIEPGVVTASGMLVNANTRCVALRDNNASYVRAAVLPSDATVEEIDRLELRLQMKRDFHSPYTFTNELLFIEDLVRRYGFSPDEIAIEMGWASKSNPRAVSRMAEQAQSYLRMLATIREVQDMSDGKIRTVSFDSSRQALIELDGEIERLKGSNYEGAREVHDARLAGILSGVGYRELREIGPGFVEGYLIPAMEDRESLTPHIDVLTRAPAQASDEDIPGLEILENAISSPVNEPSRSASVMLELLTKDADHATIKLAADDGGERYIERELFCNELKTAIEEAAEDVQLEREAGDLLNRPRDLVRKATKQTQAAIEAYREVESNPEFDRDRLTQAVSELGSAYAALRTVIHGAGGQ